MSKIGKNISLPMNDLHNHRQIYNKGELRKDTAHTNPFEQFRDWFLDAEHTPNVLEANAMSIATLDPDGCPRTRMVLLKGWNEKGFIFYTNYQSQKGKALEKYQQACLHFFWPSLERQIIIKAQIARLAQNLSDGYFESRPRGSQLGAIVSPQSQVIPNREYLENKLQKLEAITEGKEIERPEHWGGYIAIPYEFEFWQGRPNRLHDRLLYTLKDLDWYIDRLAP